MNWLKFNKIEFDFCFKIVKRRNGLPAPATQARENEMEYFERVVRETEEKNLRDALAIHWTAGENVGDAINIYNSNVHDLQVRTMQQEINLRTMEKEIETVRSTTIQDIEEKVKRAIHEGFTNRAKCSKSFV